MNRILSFILLLLPSILMAQHSASTLSSHGLEIKTILIQDTVGMVRGISIGSSISEIRAREKGKVEAEGKDFIIYKVEINDKESAEIIYTFDEQMKVKMITIAFMENINTTLEEQVLDDFQRYFTERYGKNRINEKNEEVWTTPEGYIIEMGDSSSGSGDILEIEIDI